MKISINKKDLLKILYRVQGIAEKNTTIPILSHVLLQAIDGNKFVVNATDMDVGLSSHCNVNIEKEGSVCVLSKQFFEIIRSLSEEVIQIECLENNWINISCRNTEIKLAGMNADEFPSLPEYKNIKTCKIPASDLVDMVEKTLFCVSTNDNRVHLSGIYCVAEKKTLRLVSTDGHRLSIAEKIFDFEIPFKEGVVVPKKGFQELKKILTDSNEVEIGFSKNSGLLKTKVATLSTRLIGGNFPDYKQVIPNKSEQNLSLKRIPFMDTLRRVSLISQECSYGIKLELTKNQLTLTSENPEYGKAIEVMEINYGGEDIIVGFNARYILDVLPLIKNDEIIFGITDQLSPGVISSSSSSNNEKFLNVIMPMRV